MMVATSNIADSMCAEIDSGDWHPFLDQHSHTRWKNVRTGEIQRLAAEDWSSFRGPRGGTGWKNVRTGKVKYQRDRPGGNRPKSKSQPEKRTPAKFTGIVDELNIRGKENIRFRKGFTTKDYIGGMKAAERRGILGELRKRDLWLVSHLLVDSEGGYHGTSADIPTSDISHFKHPDEVIDRVDEFQNDNLSAIAGKIGMSAHVLRDQVNESVKEALKDALPFIRVELPVVSKILQSGRFLSQHEMDLAAGEDFMAEVRSDVELEVMGVPRGTLASYRPIYGYLSSLRPGDPGPSGHADTTSYGDVVVELKENLKDRSTVTFQDSMGAMDTGNFMATPVSKPNIRSVDLGGDELPYKVRNKTVDGDGYTEAQIHNGISLKDIEKVWFESSPDAGLAKEMKKAGVSWGVVGKPVSMAAEDWSSFRGPRGGTGWKNVRTGKVKYQKDRPGGRNGSVEKTGIATQRKERVIPDITKSTKKEYAGDIDDYLGGETGPLGYKEMVEKFGDEAVTKAYADVRDRDKEWDRYIRRELSLGRTTEDDARKIGYFNASGRAVEPLPKYLYHVTTASDSILRDGLKTRDELGQRSGKGLGAGPDDTISFTDSPKIASGIHRAMIEARSVARGEISVQDMLDYAKRGDGVGKPWLRRLVQRWDPEWNDGDKLPFGLQLIVDGRERGTGMGHPPRDGTGWEPVGDGMWDWTRKLDPDEDRDERFDFYKRFAFIREDAGGPLDPLFMSTDVGALAESEPDQIHIMQFKPKPNAQGYKVSALGEWRTWTGDAVDVVRGDIEKTGIAKVMSFRWPDDCYLDSPVRMAAEDWQAFRGPRGGTGWKNVRTGEVKYQKDRPGGKEKQEEASDETQSRKRTSRTPDEVHKELQWAMHEQLNAITEYGASKERIAELSKIINSIPLLEIELEESRAINTKYGNTIVNGNDKLEASDIKQLQEIGIKLFASRDEQDEYTKTATPKELIGAPLMSISPTGERSANHEARVEVKKKVGENISNHLLKELSRDDILWGAAAVFTAVRFEGDTSIDTGDLETEMGSKASHLMSSETEEIASIATRAIIKTWAQSSSDNNVLSVAVQLAVQEKFAELFESDVQSLDYVNEDVRRASKHIYNSRKPFFDAVVGKMYSDTQVALKNSGVEELLLYRGMSFMTEKDTPAEIKSAMNKSPNWNDAASGGRMGWHTKSGIRQNPISSWSTDYKTAISFAGQGITDAEASVMSTATVPRERIFCTSLTGFGCLTESELLVVGGDPLNGDVTISDSGVPWAGRGTRGEFLQASDRARPLSEGEKLSLVRLAAEDWNYTRGPRGGSVWTNVRTGEVRHQKENPGGKASASKEETGTNIAPDSLLSQLKDELADTGMSSADIDVAFGGMPKTERQLTLDVSVGLSVKQSLARHAAALGMDNEDVPRVWSGGPGEKLHVQMSNWIDKVEEEDEDMVTKYTADGSRDLNEAMRECPEELDCLGDEDGNILEGVSRAISAAGLLPHTMTAWRGVPGGGESGKVIQKVKDAIENGQTIGMNGIQSLSFDPGTATRFSGSKDSAVVFEVRCKSGAYVEEVAELHNEFELLHDHGQRYRPLRILNDVPFVPNEALPDMVIRRTVIQMEQL